MAVFNLIADAAPARSLPASAQRLVNLFPEKMGDQIILYGTPGLRLLVTVGNGPIRAAFPENDNLYVVSGNTVYSVDSAWSATSLGTIGTSTGPAYIDSNGVELIITDGSDDSYIVTLATNTLAAITDPDWPGAGRNGFIDGRFVFNDPDTGRFYATDAYGGGSIDGLSFATAEGGPDNLVGLIVDHREVWLFGQLTTEVWYNAGTSGFPFARIDGAYIEHGCAAAASIMKMDNTVYWLGRDARGKGMVWRASGYSPERISDPVLEYHISNYSDVSDAVAWGYTQDGHAFYVLSFPTADVTWCYDATTGRWHQMVYRNPADGSLSRHRGNCHAFFSGTHVVGDWETGKLYALEMDTYTDNGELIARKVIGQHINSDGGRVFYDEVELLMETGVGLTSGDGSDPQVMLRHSNDGGRTWSSERWASAGKIGEYERRVRWQNLGSAFQRTFEVSITAPVKVAIRAAILRFGKGV